MAHWHSMQTSFARRNHRAMQAVIALATGMGVLACTSCFARALRLDVRTLQTPVAIAAGVHVRVQVDADGAAGRLQVDVDDLDARGFGYRFGKLHWECPLVRASGAWTCTGPVGAATGPPMRLQLTLALPSVSARISSGASAVGVQWAGKASDPWQVALTQVPVAWVQAFTATLWKDGRLQKGALDGQLAIRSGAKSGTEVHGRLRAQGLSLETPDGGIAAGGIDIDAGIAFVHTIAQRKLAIDAKLAQGEFLIGGLYAVLPKQPLSALLEMQQAGTGDWLIPRWRWDDGAVVTATGDGRWSPAQGLRALNLQLQSSDLATAHDRYLTGWLDPAGLAGLRLAGAVQAGATMQDGVWRSVAAQLRAVDAIDGKQRFSLQGLDGDLRWSADAPPVDGMLRWRAGGLLGIPLGPTALSLRSQSRHIALTAPVGIPMLGGTLRLDRFDYVPPDAADGARFAFGLSLQKMQVAQLAKAFGWPAFPGTLDGSLPSAHYANNRLDFDGALNAQVFGGRLAVTRLAMERPFGADPSVSADMDIKGFDLRTLTEVFGFGRITGRLDGTIRDLRLLDWAPVAFDARLASDEQAPDRRRISQRAVRDLTTVGGGGITAGLQAQALKLFQDFGYARLGLSCKLANDVCSMDGVGSAGAGYTILQGSGLPRIDIIGYERHVDWPTLLARLKAATQGDIVIK